MADIKNKLRALPVFCSLDGVSEKQIDDAAKTLELLFADDYRDYLLAFGVASVEGHEFTGICDSKRLNVVDVTRAARSITPGLPQNWYVLEEANIDGIIIWQSSSGEVYRTQPGREAVKIAHSICDYLDLTYNRIIAELAEQKEAIQ